MGRQGPLSQAPAGQPSTAPLEEPTAKTESCLSTSVLAHAGHPTSSPKRATSFSKRDPQAGQTYS